MRNMFENAISFNQPINNWNINKRAYIQSMFKGATRFNQSIDKWKINEIQKTSLWI